MLTITAIAEIAALVGDPARTAMLVALMDGRALTAGELARVAGITPQTASSHLAGLTQAGLLSVERQGRHRFHRLASPTVAAMVEGIMAVAAPGQRPARTIRTGPRDLALRHARICYDHLAGEVAVGMADCLRERGHLVDIDSGGRLTEDGLHFLGALGVDVEAAAARVTRRSVLCRPCLDWSERRPHIAGTIGAALRTTCLERQWIRPVEGSRALTITREGSRTLAAAFDLKPLLEQGAQPRQPQLADPLSVSPVRP